MTCPYAKRDRCSLAARLARRHLSLETKFQTTAETCEACLAQGTATLEKPTEACIELVTLLVPKQFAAKWKAVADARDFAPPPPKPEPSKPEKSRGLGDTVAKLTKAVGIQPCGGCQKRREWLNKMVPYGDGDAHS